MRTHTHRLLSLAAATLLVVAAGCGTDTTGDGSTDGGGSAGPISVSIDAPGDGASFAPDESVSFTGHAVDTRTGEAIAATALEWSSDQMGRLGFGETIRTALTEGEHTITLTATAPDETFGTASIHLTVAVPPLEVRVVDPADRDIFQTGETITFRCVARAGGAQVAGATYVWRDQDGQIGIGQTVQTALPDGPHAVTCEASDPATGESGADSVSITVGEPALRIDRPQEGQSYTYGETVTFRASVITSDPAPYQVTWKSSVDGQLGIGQTVQTALASEGTHVITASFTDAAGKTATDAVTISYVKENTPPEVTITAPAADGDTRAAGATVSFEGRAVDAEDGDIAASGTWSDPSLGSLGDGATARIAAAAPGKYEVTFEARDSAGAVGRDTRLVYVAPAGGDLVSVSLEGTQVSSVAPATGGAWLASEGGFVYDGATRVTLGANDVNLQGTPTAVAEGGGRVAFGTGEGLSVCTGGSPAGLSCTSYSGQLADALDTRRVVDLVVLSDGTVAAATGDGLFVVTPGGDTRAYDGNDWNGSSRIRDLDVDADETVYLATENGLIAWMGGSGFAAYPRQGLASSNLRAVAVGGGEIWVGHDEGLSRFVPTGAGGGGGGIGGTWRNYGGGEGLANTRVRALDLDARGIVWGGTDGGGAFRFGEAVGRFLMITTDDGLPSNVVRSVLVDALDVKWLGTDRGLAAWYGR